MATANNLRKMLHRKAWEMATPCNTSFSPGGSFLAGDRGALMPSNDCTFHVSGASSIYNYNADQDAWLQLPNSGIAGAFAAGACGEFRTVDVHPKLTHLAG